MVLLRHPQPLVGPGICYGSTDLDVAHAEVVGLVPVALQQCPKNALLFSSPLRRCSQLAKALSAALSVPLQLDARLVEMNFGRWEMQAWDQIDRAEIDAWAAAPETYVVGAAESVLQMAHRVSAFYDELSELRRDCVVVCHAGTMRLLQARNLGYAPFDMATHAVKNNSSIAYGQTVVLSV